MTLPQNQHGEAKFDKLQRKKEKKKETKWKTSAENVHNTQHVEQEMGGGARVVKCAVYFQRRLSELRQF